MTCCELLDALTNFYLPLCAETLPTVLDIIAFSLCPHRARLPRGRGFQGQGGDFIVNGNNVLEGVESRVQRVTICVFSIHL